MCTYGRDLGSRYAHMLWPFVAHERAYQARTAAGTSWQFILLITLGYVAGIAAKFCAGAINWVLAVYFLNMIFLGFNWAIYFRNRTLDKTTAMQRAARRVARMHQKQGA